MRMFAAISPQALLRIMLASLLMLVLFYWWNGILPHQLTWSPLFDISLDNTFWLYHLTGIPAWMNDHRWTRIDRRTRTTLSNRRLIQIKTLALGYLL